MQLKNRNLPLKTVGDDSTPPKGTSVARLRDKRQRWSFQHEHSGCCESLPEST